MDSMRGQGPNSILKSQVWEYSTPLACMRWWVQKGFAHPFHKVQQFLVQSIPVL